MYVYTISKQVIFLDFLTITTCVYQFIYNTSFVHILKSTYQPIQCIQYTYMTLPIDNSLELPFDFFETKSLRLKHKL